MAAGHSLAAQTYEAVLILLVGGMVGVGIRAWTTNPGGRDPVGYLVVGVLAVLAGHLVAVLSEDSATGGDSPWIDVCWVISYLALAAAFSHPRAVLMSSPKQRALRLTRGRLALLGLALLVLPVAIAAIDLRSGDHKGVVLAVAAAVLAPLVLGRIATLASLHAAAERRLHTLATVDELTGLPNRRAISGHLTEILSRCATGDSSGAVVMFLDLDDFKLVNDEYGHATGDRLLVEVAQRLRSAVRSTDLVGRFGGDEFVVAMEGRPEPTRDAALATLGRALAEPVVLDGAEASAAASIGARLVRPGETVSAEQALSAADAGMYVVKHGHRADVEAAGEPA